MKKLSGEENNLLYESILKLETAEECRCFLQDLCTVGELKAMEQRIEVAMCLRRKMSYQDILAYMGVSTATISRVNRALQYGAEGYQTILPRLDEFWEGRNRHE